MTPTQHPEPTGLAGVLADHFAAVGPITGAWTCGCGETATLGSIHTDNLTSRSQRRDEHIAHIAEQVRAWLGERLASDAVVDQAARSMSGPAWWAEDGDDEIQHAIREDARAALNAARAALDATEDEGASE